MRERVCRGPLRVPQDMLFTLALNLKQKRSDISNVRLTQVLDKESSNGEADPAAVAFLAEPRFFRFYSDAFSAYSSPTVGIP